MVGGNIFLAGDRFFERRDGEVVIAVTEHALTLGRRFPARSLVAERRFDWPGCEKDPAVVIRALGRWRRQSRVRERIGEVAADRRDLGHHLALVDDGGDL